MQFAATRHVFVNANNPSSALKVPEGQQGCNTGQYIQFYEGGEVCGAALTPDTTIWEFKLDIILDKGRDGSDKKTRNKT